MEVKEPAEVKGPTEVKGSQKSSLSFSVTNFLNAPRRLDCLLRLFSPSKLFNLLTKKKIKGNLGTIAH